MITSKSLSNGLKDKTDLELVNMVRQDNDNEAFLEISERYSDVYYKICHKYSKRLTASGLDCNDIFAEKDIIILNCIKNFNPEKKTKLSSWIGNHARYFCLNSLNSRKNFFPIENKEISKTIENSQSYSTDNIFEYLRNNRAFFENILDQLSDKRISRIIKMRFLGEKKQPWAKIASELDMSIQSCTHLGDKGLNILKRKILSKDYMDTV